MSIVCSEDSTSQTGFVSFNSIRQFYKLKYSCEELDKEMAKILHEVSRTGCYPQEITHGILTPLQKLGKQCGPTDNLYPIILFSILRKILAICLLERQCYSNLSSCLQTRSVNYKTYFHCQSRGRMGFYLQR